MAKKTGSSKKRTVKVEPIGEAHIHASFNNIIISVNQDLNIGSIYPSSLIVATGKIGGTIGGQIIIKQRLNL